MTLDSVVGVVGPNDASGVVWARFRNQTPSILLPVEFFIDYNLYIVVSNKQMRRNKKKTYYWPKRRQTRRLGPFSSSTPYTSLPVVYSVVYNRFTL